MQSEDVVDSADARSLAKEGNFSLRVLTLLHAFMHGPDDVCFCQELVCDTAAKSTATPGVICPWTDVSTKSSGRIPWISTQGKFASGLRTL